ncbi:MAG: hypothetical protein ACOZQL_12535 [Myxococcota bacterium]
MQFRAFEPDVEVNGQTVWAIVDGFISKATPSRILLEEGIGTPGPGGVVQLDRAGWYAQDAWLRAFERIATSMGDNMLFNIGKRIPENALFPPSVVDVESAIASIDVAYHLNHRRAGQVLFDQQTGKMQEGIGHYGCERPDQGRRLIISVCRNPYPCEFDRGILTAMARRFAPAALVTHAEPHHCRKSNSDECTYHVKW